MYTCTWSIQTPRDSQSNTMQLTQDSHFYKKMSCLRWDSNPTISTCIICLSVILSQHRTIYMYMHMSKNHIWWGQRGSKIPGQHMYTYTCMWMSVCMNYSPHLEGETSVAFSPLAASLMAHWVMRGTIFSVVYLSSQSMWSLQNTWNIVTNTLYSLQCNDNDKM